MESARRIDSRLSELGHHVEVACLDSLDTVSDLDYPATVHALGPVHGSYAYCRPLLPWLKENHARFDAVIVGGLWQYHSLAVWRVLKDADVPYVVFPHGMLDPWFKSKYPLKHLKKWLYWPWAEYRVLRDASAVVFTSADERVLAKQSFWLSSWNGVVTAYGTASPPGPNDAQRDAFLEQCPDARGKKVILFLGRLHEKKGCDLLIEAFARVRASVPSAILVIAGPDQKSMKRSLEEKAQTLGVSHLVAWPGMLQGDAKWGAIYAAEVLCLPSHQENFGIVVAEALGCSTPVLISNRVNIWREVEQDGAGIIHENTVEATARALQRWLLLPEADQRSMRCAARDCFDRRFRIDRVADSVVSILERCLNDKAAVVPASRT